MTTDQLAVIESRNAERLRIREAATPMPWSSPAVLGAASKHLERRITGVSMSLPDWRFISAARNDTSVEDIAALIAALRQEQEEVKRLRADLAGSEECCRKWRESCKRAEAAIPTDDIDGE